jgi:kynurenine formamidase
MTRERASNEQVYEWFDTLKNWGRWGNDELMGTLNHITPEKRRQAAALVSEGKSISCGLPIRFWEHNLDDNWPEPRRFMFNNADPKPDATGRNAWSDAVNLNCHGLTLSHIDSPAHSFFRTDPNKPYESFNGITTAVVTTRDGCKEGAITLAGDGIVSRGVLLDLARLKGVDWLEPGSGYFSDDLEEAEKAQGVRVQPGDILCIRSGQPKKKRQLGWNSEPLDTQAGPEGQCLPWFKERDIALLACDTANDVFPPAPGYMARPVHCIGISSIGLWLLDGADYEALSEECARLGRWEFMMTIAPLKLEGCTASPVNAIAVL